MAGATEGGGAGRKAASDAALPSRRCLATPLRIDPAGLSSPALRRRRVASVTCGLGEAVLALGAGTGVVSRALLDAGVPPYRLAVAETLPCMAEHLSGALPGAEVQRGDAFDLARLLPRRWHGRIGTAICGIPLVLLSSAEQRRSVQAVGTVAPGRRFHPHT